MTALCPALIPTMAHCWLESASTTANSSSGRDGIERGWICLDLTAT